MKEFLEILKYILPSLVVLLTTFVILKTFFDKEKAKRRFELRHNNQKIITPIRLQAYERMILFLERISPESLVLRVQNPTMSVIQLQKKLLSTIRSEFAHNLSQQIYVSAESWEAVKTAKESIVKLINLTSSKHSANKSASELSRIIIHLYAKIDNSPTDNAIIILKTEIQDAIL